MPETITKEITVYKFDELSPRAKERALEEWQDHMFFDDEDEISYHKSEGRDRGFEIEDVRYQLNFSQGDGASWQGQIDLGRFLDHHLKDDHADHARYIVLRELIRDGWLENVDVIYRGFRGVHSNNMTVEHVPTKNLDNIISLDGALGDDEITCESILKGANVAELAQGIDYEKLLDDFRAWMEDKAREYAEGIYEALRTQYEHESSEEYFKDMAEANDWRFDEEGISV